MDGAKPNSSYQGHRGACDQCSQRKVRCTPASGACQNCIAWGKTCTYSPKIPSGRPRKRPATGHKEPTTGNIRQNQVQPPPSPSRPPLNKYKSCPQDIPPLTRSSASLSSIESQLVTPPPNIMSTNPAQDMDMLCPPYQNGFCGENSMCDQDYFSSIFLGDQDCKMDSTYADLSIAFPPQFAEMSRTCIMPDDDLQMEPRSAPLHYSAQRTTSSFILPRRKSESGALTFTSLLSAVMDLRSKYDGLKVFTQSYPRPGQTLPDTMTTIDQIINSFSQYFDEIEPYLTPIYRRFGGLSTDEKRQMCNDVHEKIHVIVAGSSIVVETAYTLHELLHILCRSESKGISTRLDSVLRFSTIDFHIRRCIHSFGLISDILTANGSEASKVESSLQDLSTAKSSAEALRMELAHAIDELKTPVF